MGLEPDKAGGKIGRPYSFPARTMTRKIRPLAPAAFLLLLTGALATGVPVRPAFAFTEKQIDQVFAILDSNKTGKVDRAEYDQNKVAAMFWRAKTGDAGLGELSYDDTEFNRAFFDAADTDHKGKLDGVDLIYALDFDKIDTDHKGYITLADLRRFMVKAGR
jgi:hypothetical protein